MGSFSSGDGDSKKRKKKGSGDNYFMRYIRKQTAVVSPLVSSFRAQFERMTAYETKAMLGCIHSCRSLKKKTHCKEYTKAS